MNTALQKQLAEAIPAITWGKPKPLTAKLHPVEPFDLALLPDALKGWINDISERMDNQPYDYAAIGAMCSLGALLGARLASTRKSMITGW